MRSKFTKLFIDFVPELLALANRYSYSDTTKQAIVKLQVIDDISLPSDLNNSPKNAHSVEINLDSASIQMSNNVSQSLLPSDLSYIEGSLW